MGDSRKDLLNLENNSSSSTIESKLIVCQHDDFRQTQNPKSKPPDGMFFTSSVPQSQVLGKAKDFLGVFLEANERLQHDAKDNAKDYDIEALTGSESEYIEMDLMLGVADLHTPEALAAAERAIVDHQPVISLAVSSSSDESSSDESNDDENGDDGDHLTCSPTKIKRPKPVDDDCSTELSRNGKSKKKRAKIIELS